MCWVSQFRSSHKRCSRKKGVLRNFPKFTGKHLCQSLFFNKVAGLRPTTLLKKETLAQVFSCVFCKISENIFFTEHLRKNASVNSLGHSAVSTSMQNHITDTIYIIPLHLKQQQLLKDFLQRDVLKISKRNSSLRCWQIFYKMSVKKFIFSAVVGLHL